MKRILVALLITVSLTLTAVLARRPFATFLYEFANESLRQEGTTAIPAATKYLEYAVKVDPSHPKAWGRLCGLYEMGQRYDDAIEPCRRQIKIAPSASTYHSLGLLLFKKDNVAAADAFEHSIQMEPSRCFSYGYLSDIRKAQGRADEALAVLQKGYAKNKEGYCHLCYDLAYAYFQRQRFEEALEPLECAIKTDQFQQMSAPGSMKLMLGYLFEVKGMRAEAQQAYREFDKSIPKGAVYSCLPREGRAFDYKNCRVVRKG